MTPARRPMHHAASWILRGLSRMSVAGVLAGGLASAATASGPGKVGAQPMLILARNFLARRLSARAISLLLVGVFLALAFEVASGSGDWIWAWNQANLSEFAGHVAAFRVDGQGSNPIICSGYNSSNRYIGVTASEWSSEKDYIYSGVVRFSGLGSRAGVSVYYQDTANHYQVNIQAGDSDPMQGGLRLRRFNNGVEFQLIEDNSLELGNNTWYPFRVSVETLSDRTLFQLEVDAEDGTHRLEYEDLSADRFSAGRVGLRKKQGPDACWDDLTVVSLGGTPPAATPTVVSATPGGTPPPTPAVASATPTSTAASPTSTSTATGGRSTRTPVSTNVATATAVPETSSATAVGPTPTKTTRMRTPTSTP
jgi:hypothetical protein